MIHTPAHLFYVSQNIEFKQNTVAKYLTRKLVFLMI